MKIVLLGYMASGKSTVGKHLAKKMEVPFIDLDAYIEAKENMVISTVFKEKGEIYFRKKEHYYLQELLNTDTNFVLSLGGGAPCYAGNMDLVIASNAISIYLQANIKILTDRLLKEKIHRPLMANLEDKKIPEFIAKHLFERTPFYEKATHKIKGDGKDIETIASEVLEQLNI